MSWLSGWRLALRLARREAWRSKARSVLVLVMVTFPVVAVIAADVAQATASVSSVEGLDREIGSAAAKVTVLPHASRVVQTANPDDGGYATAHDSHGSAASLATIQQVLGGPRPAIEVRSGEQAVRTDLGVVQAQVNGVDLASPLANGLYRLTSGRLPTHPGEVAVNADLLSKGFAVGDSLTIGKGATATIVGTAESTTLRSFPIVVGPTDLVPATGERAWLVGGAPVNWHQVRSVNAVGGLVLSRQVVQHPPSRGELPPQMRDLRSGDDSAVYAVLALVGVMALLEVVLLAGPAFAVGARRQSRSLALVAANGGTPTQSRRIVLGTAVVIGAFAACLGLGLGILVARGVLPFLQRPADTYFGPFQIRWTHVLGAAAFGLISACLAAVVPAWIASRQDVVAVLAGRRGDRAPSRRSPFIGLALTAAGVVLAVLGARRGSGEMLIAGAAVLSVFGMIFLVPVVVVGVARLGRRFPLPLRYAVRDAARHRTRTVPAVAAVAATVAGAVALSIGNTSDQAQAKAEYVPEYAVGVGAVTDYSHHRSFVPAAADILRKAGADPRVLDGVTTHGSGTPHAAVTGSSRREPFATSDLLGVDTLVADRLPAILPDAIDARERAAADAVLARGGAVLFAQGPAPEDRVSLAAKVDSHHHQRTVARATVPAYVADIGHAYGPAGMFLSKAAAHRLSLPVVPAAVLFDATKLDPKGLDAVEQQIQALSPQGANVFIERGYQVPSSERVVLWILFGLAGVLMLGGTLTATFLALSDARPDLATLSAVGASPRMRRAVASAYAVSVGVVGAVLGAAVGFVPGIAVSYPLTRDFTGGSGPSHYLSIPWLEIVGLVVLLPLLTALVVGLLARSRLPLVARLD
ncbi:MAG TPA: FtsX-like permease family protein [Nocardioides sp.]|nr:FtsX-like permease family protein [Nocardioides sp.]